MVAVFKTEDERLARIVAINRVTDSHLDPIASAARARGARGLGAESPKYRDDLRDRGLPSEAVVTLGAEVAEALACAHAAGLVHRDIEPANVFINARGVAKVLDFGIAKTPIENPDVAITAPGMIVGTIPYVSPEYAGAGREYEEALGINPQSYDAHYFYARVSFQVGQDERAAELYRRGAELRVEDSRSGL